MTINPDKYYRTGKIMLSDAIIEAKGRYWLRRQIKNGRLPATNTSTSEERPRFVVKGSDLIDFIATLHKTI